MPGLVNAHCHLDYTDMAGQPAPKQFPDWIKGLLARKAAASYADYAQAWLRGAAMLLRTGVTTVGDIEAVPELLPDVWSSTPLRVGSFLEMTCVRSRRDPAPSCGKPPPKSPRSGPNAGLPAFHRTPSIRQPPICCAPALNWPPVTVGASPCTLPNRLMSSKCASMAGAISSTGSKASATCRTAAMRRPSNKSAAAA